MLPILVISIRWVPGSISAEVERRELKTGRSFPFI